MASQLQLQELTAAALLSDFMGVLSIAGLNYLSGPEIIKLHSNIQISLNKLVTSFEIELQEAKQR